MDFHKKINYEKLNFFAAEKIFEEENGDHVNMEFESIDVKQITMALRDNFKRLVD